MRASFLISGQPPQKPAAKSGDKSTAASRSTASELVLQRTFTSERLVHSRLFALGPEAPALIDFIMSPSCPVSASLTNVDRGELVGIKQAMVGNPAKQSACPL